MSGNLKGPARREPIDSGTSGCAISYSLVTYLLVTSLLQGGGRFTVDRQAVTLPSAAYNVGVVNHPQGQSRTDALSSN